ncbi:hypothetical protein PLICRDRAFT_101004 [Plicaturopsis crispa FD-325 SS-3]|nr:hypothetical protein PLICRDRAFT_101004 [Plicaturopsis crispa FD-325 SS-3]
MPKSGKARRSKAADFAKAKLKLGKGKQLASNAIDTSFKARSIALPTQSIAVEKDDAAPTTKRRLTFEDLITHLKHYNAGARKDAILGLRELFAAHPELIESSLTTLFNACVRIIGDEDASVRKTLLSFLTWLLPQIPPENLVPHSPSLLLFTTSAQTHIFPEIRIDAVRFLDLFLDIIPQTVVPGWDGGSGGHGGRVLEGYLGILNAGTKFGESDGPMKATSSASVVVTPKSKLVVLKSLSNFLRSAISSPHAATPNPAVRASATPIPTWYLLPSFDDPHAYEAFDRLVQPTTDTPTSARRRPWIPTVDFDEDHEDFVQSFDLANPPFESECSLQNLSDVGLRGLADTDGDTLVDSTFVAHLSRTLHSTLISTFLDCAPQVFSPSTAPPETEVQLVITIAEIARSLYSAIFQGITAGRHDLAVEDLKTLLGYMSTYFPYGRSMATKDIKLEQAFQELNLIYCELTSLLVLGSWSTPTTKARAKHRLAGASKADAALALQTERVSEYVVQLLRGEASSGQLPRPLTPAAYTALLPTIWSLLNNPTSNNRSLSHSVLQATVDHATRVSSSSALKKPTIEFVSRLALLETEIQYRGSFKIAKTGDDLQKFEEWVKHLPKTLWELGAKSVPVTEIILRFLLRLFQRKSCLVHAETIAAVRSRLAPFFGIVHPVRGPLPGPYTKIPAASPVRRLAIDVVVSLSRMEGTDELVDAVGRAVVGTDEGPYWEQLRTTAF